MISLSSSMVRGLFEQCRVRIQFGVGRLDPDQLGLEGHHRRGGGGGLVLGVAELDQHLGRDVDPGLPNRLVVLTLRVVILAGQAQDRSPDIGDVDGRVLFRRRRVDLEQTGNLVVVRRSSGSRARLRRWRSRWSAPGSARAGSRPGHRAFPYPGTGREWRAPCPRRWSGHREASHDPGQLAVDQFG